MKIRSRRFRRSDGLAKLSKDPGSTVRRREKSLLEAGVEEIGGLSATRVPRQFQPRALRVRFSHAEGPPVGGVAPASAWELVAAGLKDVQVETTTERMEFKLGAQLWAWLTNSNPIVEGMLAGLALTEAEKRVIQETLDDLVRQRAGGHGKAVLTSPINIGIGTK